jgi:hypothetical protein
MFVKVPGLQHSVTENVQSWQAALIGTVATYVSFSIPGALPPLQVVATPAQAVGTAVEGLTSWAMCDVDAAHEELKITDTAEGAGNPEQSR